MSNWIKLDQSRLMQGQDVVRDGVHVQVFVSPYDIPEAVRGERDKETGRFTIEFRYLSDDNSFLCESNDEKTVCLIVGKNSGRLCRIELDLNKLGVGRVGLSIIPTVEHAVDEAINRLVIERMPKQRNYNLAKEVISQRRQELFADLVAE